MTLYRFPDGRRFAFTIIDDTDVGTVENLVPIYRLLQSLGMRTTKTVWPMPCPEGSRDYAGSDTLEDEAYRAFVVDLQARGFEIAFHGATMESSTRERTVAALERFRDTFGGYPAVHANHAYNRENVYWGEGRVDAPLLRRFLRRTSAAPPDYYQGHVVGSPYWWGDLLSEHVQYVRNLTFDDVNLLRVNPTMPYHDPRRPLVRWWFSGTDADSVDEFRRLLAPRRQERLEREGGVCIVATHFGKRYVRDGEVDPEVRERLAELAGRNGWFPPVGELLDWMRRQHGGPTLPVHEWRRMQWRWVRDRVREKAQRRVRRLRRSLGIGSS